MCYTICLFQLKEYRVVGRKLPTEGIANPPIYQMRIFAPDRVVAVSRFWYFAKLLKKMKKYLSTAPVFIFIKQIGLKHQVSD